MTENIKSVLMSERIFAVAMLIVVGGVSFYLGRLSIGSTAAAQPKSALVPAGVIMAATPQKPATPLVSAEVTGGDTVSDSTVIASKSGTRYHALSCPGAKQIKENNRLFFPNPEAAEAAGYTRAQNCPE